MRKKEHTVALLFVLVVMLGFVVLTLKLSSNTSISELLVYMTNKNSSGQEAGTQPKACSSRESLNIVQSSDPHLNKLKAYQDACGSFAASSLMYFTSFPENTDEADALAKSVAETIDVFNKSNVHPLVVVEPYLSSGPMSYRAFLNGDYDAPLRTFFQNLKDQGFSDELLGTWVPFPESNTPSWNNKDTEPRDFALAVNRYLGILKEYFPTTKGSILLNATTYEPTDLDYENGDYISLIPYLQDLDRTLVSSVGIQGFPWVSRADQVRREIFRPSEFLQPDYAVEAARELRTRDIWFNTGSFSKKYTNDPSREAAVSVGDRKAILMGILEEAKAIHTLQQNEYRVTINIFAEDKSETNEATNWSYLGNAEAEAILKEFFVGAHEAGIGVSLFDR